MAATDPAYHRITISIPPLFRAHMIMRLAGLGSLGVIEEEQDIVAYFPDSADMDGIMRELGILQALILASDPGLRMRITRSRIPTIDWNARWKNGFTRLDVGQSFTILPPWEQPPSGRIPIIIDPGMAFGTGHHETTRSCLVLMERYAPQVQHRNFLDIGTGTGLLAIAAIKLGFVRSIAVDNDPKAIAAAGSNMELNGTSGIELVEGGIAAVAGTYDLIAANLISGTLVALAGDIKTRLDPAGAAILSGILVGQESEVVESIQREGLRLYDKLVDGKWISLVVGR